jgi:predicted  nucleic acid-binding Zn-ribbon protein
LPRFNDREIKEAGLFRASRHHPPLAICRLPFIITGVSRVSDLYRLQQLDTEIGLRGSQLVATNDQIANSPAVLQAQAEHKTAQDSLAAARKQAKALDDENRSLTTKIKVEEERLYGGKVKNPRELKDLQAEIESLKQKRESLDEQQLTAMDAVDGAEKIEAAARANLAKVEAARAGEINDLIAKRETLQSLIINLQESRKSMISNITSGDLDLYESLRKRKRGVAVVALANSSCKGCGESQSSSRIQIAKQEVEIARCANCERILYGGQEAGYTTVEGGDDEMVTRW